MSRYRCKWAQLSEKLRCANRFQRFQTRHPDRKWLYENAEEPVLDVGSGNCIDKKGFKKYVGVDVTLAFVKAAHFHFKVENVLRADAAYLPFKDRSFKTAYAKDLLLHYLFKDALKFLKEMIRVSHTTYVAWGRGHMPSNKPEIKSVDGFFYNRFSLSELRKFYKVTFIRKGTSITLIEEVL